jgi:integrase
MAFKGLRPKEARRLKKSFFDFKEGGINLPGFEKIDGKMVRYTKNGKPRFIPLGILKKKLKAYCNSLETENLFDFTKDSFETEWEILRDSLGLTGGLYRLRHYAAVRMLKAKVNPITVAKVLGHGIQVLFKKYSRFLKQDLNDALKDL